MKVLGPIRLIRQLEKAAYVAKSASRGGRAEGYHKSLPSCPLFLVGDLQHSGGTQLSGIHGVDRGAIGSVKPGVASTLILRGPVEDQRAR